MTSPLLIDIPERLVGERIVVRAYRPGDGPALNEAVNTSIDHLKPIMAWAQKPPTLEDSEELARRSRARWELREDMGMGIWSLDESRLLGGTGLHRMDWEIRKFEIGYWIRPDEEGKGYVTECVRLLCNLAFGTLKANRVLIRCASTNERSANVPRRLGFAHEGTHRNDLMAPDGKLLDALVFGMTPEMWGSRVIGS